MSWSRLHPIPVESFVSADLGKDIEKLNAEIDTVLGNRASIDSQRRSLRATDVAEVNFDDVVVVPAIRGSVMLCLQDELRVRERMATLLNAIREESVAAYDAAVQAEVERSQEVRTALTSIGYPRPAPPPAPDTIPPMFVRRHPDVTAARLRAAELQSRTHNYDWDRENDAACQAVRGELTRVRDAA